MNSFGTAALISALLLTPSPCLALPLSGEVGIAASPLTLAVETELTAPGSPVSVSGRLGTMGQFFFLDQSASLNMNGNWLSLWGKYNLPVTNSSAFSLLLGASQSWFYDLVPIPFRSEYMRPQPMVTFLGFSFQQNWNEIGGLSRLSLTLAPSVAITTPPQTGYHLFDFFEAGMLGPALIEVSGQFTNGVTVKLKPSITPISLAFSI